MNFLIFTVLITFLEPFALGLGFGLSLVYYSLTLETP